MTLPIKKDVKVILGEKKLIMREVVFPGRSSGLLRFRRRKGEWSSIGSLGRHIAEWKSKQ